MQVIMLLQAVRCYALHRGHIDIDPRLLDTSNTVLSVHIWYAYSHYNENS